MYKIIKQSCKSLVGIKLEKEENKVAEMNMERKKIIWLLCLGIGFPLFIFQYQASINNQARRLSSNFSLHFIQQEKNIRSKNATDLSTTIISVYIENNKSKQADEKQEKWIKNFASSITRSPLVIFVNNEAFKKLKPMRKNLKTKFYIVEEAWAQNQSYKTFLMDQIARINPFKSKFFVYVDAGSFRNRSLVNWPDTQFISNKLLSKLADRIMLGQVSLGFIQSAFLAGSGVAVKRFHEKLVELRRNLTGVFNGREADLVEILAFDKPSGTAIRLRTWDLGCSQLNEDWFWFQNYFSSDPEHYCNKSRLEWLIEPGQLVPFSIPINDRKPSLSQIESLIVKKMNKNKHDQETIVSIADFSMRIVIQRWIMGLIKNGFTKFVVFCQDQQLFDYLENQEYTENVVLVPREWRQNNTNKTSKTVIWLRLTLLNLSFLYSDPNVIWLSRSVTSHIGYHYQHSYADILYSVNTANRQISFNTRFFYVRTSPFVKEFFTRVLAGQENSTCDDDDDDDELVNKVLKSVKFNDSRLDSLDPILYCSDFSMAKNLGITPLIFHAKDFMSYEEINAKSGFIIKQINDTILQKSVPTNSTEDKIKRLMKENEINGCTIVTIGNFGYREFIFNWILSLGRQNYSKFVIFSYDQNLVDNLTAKGYQNKVVLVPSNWLDYNLSTDFSSWEEDAYRKIVRSKTNVWYNLIIRNFTFIFSDPDLVWLSSKVIEHIQFQYENSYAEALFSQDLLDRTLHVNTGFFYATPTDSVKALFGAMLKRQRVEKDTMEQQIIRGILEASRFNDTRVDTLDLILYVNGKFHFEYGLNSNMNIRPLVVHANYAVGRDSKVDRLKSIGHWFI